MDEHSREPGPDAAGDWILAAFARHEKPLLRYAVWLLGDADLARDVVQETFLRLCRERPAGVRDHLAQWLFTVCRNLAVDLRRTRGRTESLDDAAILEAPDVGAALERHERLLQVLEVARSLPRNQREVVELRFQGGLSYKEISTVTGLSVGNVGFLIHTAMTRIRERVVGRPLSTVEKRHDI